MKLDNIVMIKPRPPFSLLSRSNTKSVNMNKWYEAKSTLASLKISFFVVKGSSKGLAWIKYINEINENNAYNIIWTVG